MFKIIAIKILPPRDKEKDSKSENQMLVDRHTSRYKSINKILQKDKTFWLLSGYEFKDGKMSPQQKSLPEDFFTKGKTKINISAIVGENGSGKSTLLEILLRLMNNTAYALREALNVQKKSLRFVRDVYAEVWFENNKKFFSITQKDNIIEYKEQDNSESNWLFDYDREKGSKIEKKEAQKHLSQLFYTTVLNYSQFAYNPYDYIAEWNEDDFDSTESEISQCWLTGLFQKNDAYQTPINLNPYREYGNIDINNEKDLAHTRLYKLILANHSPVKKILNNKEAHSFLFDINKDFYTMPHHRHHSVRVEKQMQYMRLFPSTNTIDEEIINDIGNNIIDAWESVTGIAMKEIVDNENWKNKDDVRTVNYIVYKTLKISSVYNQYKTYHDKFNNKKEIKRYIEELHKDNSHITLKIRRCLAYLMFHLYSTEDKLITISDFKTRINGIIDNKDKGIALKHKWTIDELLPAPSFNVDIILKDDKNEESRFSSLSSGEKQMIFSMCAIIYHLYNINSVREAKNEENITYKNVCIIFEEIELYSHPKYQMMLIKFLLDTIESMKFENIKGINIIMSTHSPFILSDLPQSNVLRIKNGKPDESKEDHIETFCANVYDILHNHFFMSRFVGDFAYDKLNEIFKQIKIPSIRIHGEKVEDIKDIVNKIGDSFIKYTLSKKLEKFIGNDSNRI